MVNNYSPFTDFRILQTFKPLERALQWEIDPIFADLSPFNFTVEASETPDFSEILYTIRAGNTFYVIDDKKWQQSNSLDIMYRIKLTTGSNRTYYSYPLVHYAHTGEKRNQYRIAKEIIRKEFVRYRYTGQTGWLLKRKNFSEHSPDTLDPITGVSLSDGNSDLGTANLGGYYPPLKVTYSREEHQESLQLSQEGFGTSTQETQIHRFVGWPVIKPYDILIADTNVRYRYITASETFMPGTGILILQICKAVLLPPTDSVYQIPVTV